MSKRIEQKYKIDRRWGVNIWGTPKSPVNKRMYRPGQHGQSRKKLSDYGVQLRAKQILKGSYGNITEKVFRNYFFKARNLKGDTGANLIGLLERRLDSVVYRAKFAPTVFSSRQLVNHGHISVNGKKVNIPSYLLKPGDQVQLKKRSWTMPIVLQAEETDARIIPNYLECDEKKKIITFMRIPLINDVPYGAQVEPNVVVALYSR